MLPTMLPNPMENAPRSEPGHEPVPVLLYCPNEGWRTGVWCKGAWRQHGHLENILHPTHWLPAGADVITERPSPKTQLGAGSGRWTS